MDLNRYNIGAGLNKIVYVKLLEILDIFDDKIRVLEFGSGMSTYFFIDYKNTYNKDLEIVSFDDSNEWCCKSTDKCLKLCLRKLIECNEQDYNYQIEKQIFNRKLFYNKLTPLTWRQRNNFYDIQENDIEGLFDIVIIDGPNGNGRNLAYNFIQEHIKQGTIIVLDDFDGRDNEFDYKFVEILQSYFDVDILYKHDSDLNANYENGGKFIIFKVK
jgi:hypothetical protein